MGQFDEPPVSVPPLPLAPPTVPGEIGRLPAAWPTTFGVISIVLGSLGLMKHAWGVVTSLLFGSALTSFSGATQSSGAGGTNAGMVASMGWAMVGQGVVSLLAMACSLWLLMAGILVAMRRPWGVTHHRWWAWVRIGVVLLDAVFVIASQLAIMQSVGAAAATAGGGGAGGAGGVGAAAPVAIMPMMWAMAAGQALFALVIGLTYPVVVLVYLRESLVRSEVARWV